MHQDNPELILRKPRQPRNARKPEKDKVQESSTQLDPNAPIESIEAEELEFFPSQTLNEEPNTELSQSLSDTDFEQSFYRSWGYLPPLDREAIAEIEAIMADLEIPERARNSQRIGAEKGQFLDGLTDRNVELLESKQSDPHASHIKSLVLGDSDLETDWDKKSHGQLWILDQAKCEGDSNEALFQRTLMMSLIARHCLIYARDKDHNPSLDFSVEAPWGCPPMPTRAYKRKEMFLTQPKPDLAVCFRRQSIMLDSMWGLIPKATLQLACYENANNEIERSKVFHFFTIEAKKGSKSPDDSVGKRQSLNNASQALHNMFEFFRDAGPKHENVFFEKVRFFSVVASTQGLIIRIHRAVRDPGKVSGSTYVMKDRPDYPLRFEFEKYLSLPKEVKREEVFETFQRILISYGEEELRPLLSSAAEALVQKLHSDPTELSMQQRQDINFYRYGQIRLQSQSRLQTSAISQAPTADEMRDQSQTSTQRRSEATRPGPTR